jgi:hypothetical protein
MCKPSQTGVRAGDRGGDGLFDFVRQRGAAISPIMFTRLICARSVSGVAFRVPARPVFVRLYPS